MGHHSAGFTLSAYTHATPEMMLEAADTMGDVIGTAAGDTFSRQPHYGKPPPGLTVTFD